MGIQLRTATKDDIPGIVRLSLVAFDPSDDVISRRLFPAQLQPPNQTPTAGLSQWISTRKTARLSMENATVLVATDDSVGNNDEVVGYAVWFLPIQDANGDDVSPDFPPPPRLSFEGGDMEAFKTLRGIMMDDERKEFGEEGAKSVLCKLPGILWPLSCLGRDLLPEISYSRLTVLDSLGLPRCAAKLSEERHWYDAA